ncbi:MAG: hypothetical protein AAF696_12420 [Bacteroidota bacterium]
MNQKAILLLMMLLGTLVSCENEEPSSDTQPKLLIKLSVDPNQERLGNLGQAVGLPDSHAGQNPMFNSLSAHYLELAPTANTQLGEGEILYHAPETSVGGEEAIDFAKSIVKSPGEIWLELPLSDLKAGSYEWVRLSLSYQNFDIVFHYDQQAYTATLASFVGFNQFIESYELDGETVAVNANKKQGYWGFKSLGGIQSGQTPEGATTVPNPLAGTSPIPEGSCVVTGNFSSPLLISGNETEDLILDMSLSINNSFEWVDRNRNNQWDVDEGANENVVDMGLRGLKPSYEWQ